MRQLKLLNASESASARRGLLQRRLLEASKVLRSAQAGRQATSHGTANRLRVWLPFVPEHTAATWFSLPPMKAVGNLPSSAAFFFAVATAIAHNNLSENEFRPLTPLPMPLDTHI